MIFPTSLLRPYSDLRVLRVKSGSSCLLEELPAMPVRYPNRFEPRVTRHERTATVACKAARQDGLDSAVAARCADSGAAGTFPAARLHLIGQYLFTSPQ